MFVFRFYAYILIQQIRQGVNKMENSYFLKCHKANIHFFFNDIDE